MTLELTTHYLDETYHVIADVSVISDNLGVANSGFIDAVITGLKVYDDHTGVAISLDGNRALKDVIEEQVKEEVFRMGLI